MLNGPFSPWPDYDEQEQQAVLEVMRSNQVNYWTGQQGRKFEREFAHFADCEYAIAVANGSVALDLAWRALALPAGSEVIVTSRSFMASVSSIVLAGLVPVFVDVDRDSQNICAETIAPAITSRTRAILCVHLAGWPCDMEAILALASEHGLKVVEDCAQAHGARYAERSVGSFGDIAAWSFCQDKIMTTAGEGGMVTTNHRDLWSVMWAFKDHGKSYDAVYEQAHPPGFRWLHESFGTNWRLTEMQAAVGRKQLQKMPAWTRTRQAYCQQIWQTCERFPALRVPALPTNVGHAGYKCYVFVNSDQLSSGWDRDRIMAAINARGVPCLSGSCSEIYQEKAFDNTSYRPAAPLPVASELGATSLMFLIHPTLSQQEIDLTCEVITQVMQEAGHADS
ncbi:DegT/DnrJ/EryC1/StrS aminotransferase family protein [Alteromonas sp. ASW11-19]|uniref:DegT/DnrJ/EryC1/StrS aminotransferase family protein n=1 Tax=Alteromonas salexigens TaxID=2982530 RepID=A0ABT2VK59_9ALTE|nr:DegT/DnrJ/EryC1/StrS aminotransferase family protein [Alteromonas salexigens]MCU7553657.1 DegT/DnrJ/EryC1/StrS aminotransferase family protein [Alteromonas salexigens]